MQGCWPSSSALIRERTNAGLAAARARGRLGGRPRKLADPKQLALAQQLYDAGQTDIATICRTLGISRTTLHRTIRIDAKSSSRARHSLFDRRAAEVKRRRAAADRSARPVHGRTISKIEPSAPRNTP
jgi:DNA invertase Pin-like site-specific DNA recombinase